MSIDKKKVKTAKISSMVFDTKKSTFEAFFSDNGKPLFSIEVSYHEITHNEWVSFVEIYEPDGFALVDTPVSLIELRWQIESISDRFMRMFKKGVNIYDGRT